MSNIIINNTRKNEVSKGYEPLSQSIEEDHARYCYTGLINSNNVSETLNIDSIKVETGFRNAIINVIGEFGAANLAKMTNSTNSSENYNELLVPAWILYLSSSRKQLEVNGVTLNTNSLMRIFRTNSFYKSLSDDDIILHIEYVLRQMSNIEDFVDSINDSSSQNLH